MEHNIDLVIQILENLPQPAFCVEQGTVCYCNRAAELQMIQTGQPLERYLSADDGLREGASASEHRLLILCGLDYGAQVYSMEDGRQLLIVDAAPLDAIPADTLLGIGTNLRGPLNNWQAAAGVLFPWIEELENPMLQEQMAAMNHAFYQILRLTFNTTNAGLAMKGQLHLLREKVEVVNYFYELFVLVESLCREAGVRFVYELPEQTFPGWLDKQRVEQAVLNLISNAVKFSARGSTLHLRLMRSGSRVVIRLRDQGEGLQPEQMSNVFSRYTREMGMEDARRGVGFGLYLTRQIATLHGGSVVIDSPPGGGTVVSLSLSIKAPEGIEQMFRSPTAEMDYTGGFQHELVELSDVLPSSVFDTVNID